MNYSANVNYYLELTLRERELIRSEIKKYPAGKLMISCEKRGVVYYQIYGKPGELKRRRITKDKELINKLARKEYLLDYRTRLDEGIDALSECVEKLKKCNDINVLDRMPPNFGLLQSELYAGLSANSGKLHPVETNEIQCHGFRHLIVDISPKEWMVLPYKINSFHSEEKIHRSSCGIMMRSKGEIAWAERLLHWGLAFHYDELLFWMGEKISPDFIVMRKDGKLFYVEHCGLMEDNKYRKRCKHKLEVYESGGIVPWDNLIITYDRPDGSIDLELIDAEIKSRLLM